MASPNTTVTKPDPEPAVPDGHAELGSHEKPRPPRARPQRPNYRHIHRFPLPLEVHPLPPLIPHNPLSIISVVLSYLTYLISPPRHAVYPAYFDPAISSVHVTDEKAIRALWEMGFFGRGSLSRSEPSWLEREKKRRGLLGDNTSEEATGKRRVERREFKLERARKEREAIAERLKQEAVARQGLTPDATPLPSIDAVANGSASTSEQFSVNKAKKSKVANPNQPVGREVEDGTAVKAEVGEKSENGTKTVRFSPVVEQKEFVADSEVSARIRDPELDIHEEGEEEQLRNEEHLQLSNEEAFFLAYGLGVLQVFDEQKSVISTASLLSLFRRHSYFPPRELSTGLEPDDPFMLSYVVYHHYRSLGWVVRSGVKFGTDYLLYNRGPVFSHAEFALVILPSYGDLYWSETESRREYVSRKQARSWWWLHCVNRVQAQVKKSLVLCYVDIPPPQSGKDDIGDHLRRYKVRDFAIKRWVPNRSRD
ncbi:tRNA-splicing endonuclease subunit Sen2 [Paecilomyces variotii No. 5]|uniref:tRNA-splicing endonuclease subunit Sen2 n=1 Tax=Byssochlamys spectabilis (strain No. 5 / NBRC 109023) TaxID=1356009 RepID=V5F809_BYSSN|nr:tRNA-splicing endonuclease subunit Sen2 [Paecilomyces variotii No. 5]